MTNRPLQLTAPDRRKHKAELIDLIAKTFPDNGYFAMRDVCRTRYIEHSHYDWQASRIGIMDGRIVTHFGVWGYDMHVGSTLVRVGGIGVVATHADYRKRGLQAKTTKASIEAMRAHGYDISILFGISDFYHKFGYVRAWSDTTHIVSINDLPKEKPTGPVRKLTTRHIDEMTKLYNRVNARSTGFALRPTYLRKHLPKLAYFWVDGRGRMAGYVCLRPHDGNLACTEAAGNADQTLRVVAAQARRMGYRDVYFRNLRHDSELCRRLRWGNCRVETHHCARADAMARVINLTSTLDKMSPELSLRLKDSPLSSWKGELLLSGAGEKAALRINSGNVQVAPAEKAAHAIHARDRIVQLLIGTDDPMDIVKSAAMRLTGNARQLAKILFPNQRPQLPERDRY